MSSSLAQKDVETVDALVAAARAAGLTHFSGSFSSHSPMHETGYSKVNFTWERGRHGIAGTVKVSWDSMARLNENFKP